MSSKKEEKTTTKKTSKSSEKKSTSTKSKKTTSAKDTKTTIPKEWIESTKDSNTDLDKGKRRSLISALRRSISVKGTTTPSTVADPMNIVITLSPAKHLDIIQYIDENIPSGGRAEWVRDSIRLKMRIEEGVYGLNTSGDETIQKGSEEKFTAVMGQFAEVMTKMMTEIKSSNGRPTRITPTPEPTRPRPTPRERPATGGPPQIKKVDTEGETNKDDLKPDRPSLDDAIGAIVIVE